METNYQRHELNCKVHSIQTNLRKLKATEWAASLHVRLGLVLPRAHDLSRDVLEPRLLAKGVAVLVGQGHLVRLRDDLLVDGVADDVGHGHAQLLTLTRRLRPAAQLHRLLQLVVLVLLLELVECAQQVYLAPSSGLGHRLRARLEEVQCPPLFFYTEQKED